MISDTLKKKLEEQQYRFAGDHSAVKVCSWTKKSLLDDGVCYKEKFYGIKSHRCCQCTTCLSCSNYCIFCWRDMSAKALTEFPTTADNPESIIKGLIEGQKELLQGFNGNKKVNKEKYKEAIEPNQFAFSVIGEPILYPRMQELLDILHKKNCTTFIVTSGQFPDHIKKVQPTQLYVSLDAPNKELLEKIDKSVFKDSWDRLNQSLENLKKSKSRTCVRITAVKDINMTDEQGYADLIKKADPLFVEVKSYMHVGSSIHRLKKQNMPLHEEVRPFAEKIAKLIGYKIIDEHERSRAFLLMKEDIPERKLNVD